MPSTGDTTGQTLLGHLTDSTGAHEGTDILLASGKSLQQAITDGDLAGGGALAGISGTPEVGDVPVVSTADPLALEWGVGGGVETVNTVASSGTSQSLDVGAYDIHDITVDDDCTLTFTNVATVRTFVLRFTGDGVGTNTVTLPGGGTIGVESGADDLTVTAMTVNGGSAWDFYRNGEPSLDAPSAGGSTQAHSFEISMLGVDVANTNWGTFTQSSAYFFGGHRSGPTAINDTVTMPIPIGLQGGTYTVALMYYSTGGTGIVDIEFSSDNATFSGGGTIDMYAGNNPRRTTISGTVPDGAKFVRLTVTGKNASSAGYQALVSAIAGYRTGA